jgi:hypothetical protein
MNKRRPGRPKRSQQQQQPIEPNYSECILCYKTFDLNSRLQEQRIINDTKFCSNCFNEFLNMNYEINIVKSVW